MGPSTRTEPDDLKDLKSHPDTHYLSKQIEREINYKFNWIWERYKTGLTGNEQADQELFAKCNIEWKGYCQRKNRLQKLHNANVFAFQNKVAKENGKPDGATFSIKEGESKTPEAKI